MDEAQAEYLVTRYADLLIRIGRTWLEDLDDAKDICQIVLIKLLEHPRAFPDKGQERAWVIRIAVNECKNWKKSAWFRRRAPPGRGPGPDDGKPGAGGKRPLGAGHGAARQIPAGDFPAVLRGVRGEGNRRAAGPVSGAGEHPFTARKGQITNHVGRYGICTMISTPTERSWTACA